MTTPRVRARRDDEAQMTPPRSFLGMRARAEPFFPEPFPEPFFPEPFLLDKRRGGFMRRANLLGDRRFLDLVGIMLLKYLIFFKFVDSITNAIL